MMEEGRARMVAVSTHVESSERGANRERILRAALDVVAREGVDKVTHRSVATRASVSPGTVTYHFSTREDLVRQAFALYVTDYEQSLVHVLTERPLNSAGDIISFLISVTALDPAATDLATIEYEMLAYSGRDEDTKMRVAGWSRALEGWLTDPLEALGARRPMEAARQLMAVCRGSEFEVMARSQALPPEQFRARLETVLSSVLINPIG